MKSSLTNYCSKSHFIFFELESLQFSFIHVTSLDKKFSFRKPSFSSLYLSPILFLSLPETNFYMQRLCLRILQSGKGQIKIHKEFSVLFFFFFCKSLELQRLFFQYASIQEQYHFFFSLNLFKVHIQTWLQWLMA